MDRQSRKGKAHFLVFLCGFRHSPSSVLVSGSNSSRNTHYPGNMKTFFNIITSFAAVVGLCSPLSADHHKKPADLVGEWAVTASTDSGERELTWTFERKEDKLTGSSKDHESGEERTFDRIKVEEKKVTVEIDVEQDGNTGVIKIVAEEKSVGNLEGKWSIQGSDGTEFMSGEMVAERKFEIVYAGDWKATSVLPDGNEMSAAMILSGKNEDLKGRFESDQGELEIGEVKAKDKSLRLAFEFDMQGSSVSAVIEADLKEKNKLVGKWIIKGDDGAEAAKGDWSAVREEKVDLAGDWSITAALPDGGEYTGTMTLEIKDGKYSGKSVNSEGEELKLDNIKFEEDKLSYSVEFERDGFSGTIKVQAKLAEDALKGEWSMIDSNGDEVAGDSWAASRKKKEKED